MMIAIAIAASGLGIIRIVRNDFQFYRYWYEYVIGVVPMACVLVFGAIAGLFDLIRKGNSHSFLVGFETVGWAILFVYVSFLAVNTHPGSRTVNGLRPITDIYDTNALAHNDAAIVFLHATVMFLPEFCLSLVGGFLSARLGITLARKAPPGSAPIR